MGKKMNVEDLRISYLNAMTELGKFAADRHSHVPDSAGMSALRSLEELEESNQMVAKLNQKIVQACNQLRSIEQLSRHELGVVRLMGEDVPNSIRVLMAILIGKSLAGSWTYELRNVGTLILPAAGDDVAEQLAVREAFGQNGMMRKYVLCKVGRTIDETSDLTFKESAFRTILALEPDTECDELLEENTGARLA